MTLLASMGPRLFRRGNFVLRPKFLPDRLASMGPRLFRRGNITYMTIHTPQRIASMGPRLFRRGNIFVPFNLFTTIASMGPRLFRRGNFIYNGSSECCEATGHVFSDVETLGRGRQPRALKYGATSFRRGNSWRVWRMLYGRFTGATSFQTWKPSGRHHRIEDAMLHGATSFQTWKHYKINKILNMTAGFTGRLFRRGNTMKRSRR